MTSSPTTHYLQLSQEPFQSIASGRKTIESRLYDEKRRAIKPGHQLVFTNRDNPQQTITATVVELLCYPTFQQLFTAHPPQEFGKDTAEQLLEQISQFYSTEDQRSHGVVGIRLQLHS